MAVVELPPHGETAEKVRAEWGGEVVILPYLEGRSTTRMMESARAAV